MTYDIIKSNFIKGLYSIPMLRVCVTKGIITKEQFYEITGEIY